MLQCTQTAHLFVSVFVLYVYHPLPLILTKRLNSVYINYCHFNFNHFSLEDQRLRFIAFDPNHTQF